VAFVLGFNCLRTKRAWQLYYTWTELSQSQRYRANGTENWTRPGLEPETCFFWHEFWNNLSYPALRLWHSQMTKLSFSEEKSQLVGEKTVILQRLPKISGPQQKFWMKINIHPTQLLVWVWGFPEHNLFSDVYIFLSEESQCFPPLVPDISSWQKPFESRPSTNGHNYDQSFMYMYLYGTHMEFFVWVSHVPILNPFFRAE